MANQTAIKVNTQPGEQLIDKYAHVYHYEGGGLFQ
jgi:threonine aldolase